MVARAERQHLRHLVLGLDDDDELGHEPVEASIGAPGKTPQRVGDEALGGNEAGGLALNLLVRRQLHVHIGAPCCTGAKGPARAGGARITGGYAAGASRPQPSK